MKKNITAKSLSRREELFCYEYIKDLNGRQALIRAGYKLSEHTSASRILCRPEIKKLIEELIKDRLEACKVTAERVINNIAATAFSDINNVLAIEQQEIMQSEYSKNGKGKKVKLIEDRVVFRPWHTHDTRAIQSIKQADGGGISVKMNDSIKANEILMKYLGLLKDGGLDITEQINKLFLQKAEAILQEKPSGTSKEP